MAILIPDHLDPDASPALEDIFRRLRHDRGMPEWMCFHSLSMVRKGNRTESDPDFVLLGPEGILVLKVMEGHVKRAADGTWRQLNRRRSPKPVRLDHGPFKEISAAMYSLRGAMTHAFGAEIDSVLFGYGVMLPDMPLFETTSPEWDADVVYQGVDRLQPIDHYVDRLARYWVHSKVDKKRLVREQLDRYEKFLRANFEVAIPLASLVNEDEQDLVWFTREQCEALDLMQENDRALIGGPAGTGKTFLAVEQARRLASRGMKTLFLCQNSLLGDFLGRVFHRPEFKGLVTAQPLLSFLFTTIKSSSFAGDFAANSKKSSGIGLYYQFFLKAVNERGVVEYDALIIDQGNDVLNGDALFALDYVLKGGFECGSWYVFYDDSTKADLGRGFESQVLSHLQTFLPVQYHLPKNCRATQGIVTQTMAVTGFPMAEAYADGEKVKYRWYDDPREQVKDLKKVLSVLLREGLQPEEITVLYPGGQLFVRDDLRGLRLKVPLVELAANGRYPPEPGKIGYASIQAFRGLENRAIVVLGIDRIGEPWVDALNYIGMSRARSILIMFMHSRIRRDYQAHLTHAVQG